jgi:hypothetical protein
MRKSRSAYRVLVGKPEGMRLLGRLGHRWKDIKLILEKWDGGHGLNPSNSGQGQVVGSSECGNEPSCSTTSVEFLE